MDKSRIADALAVLIKNEITETDRLLDLLRREREQIHGNPDHLLSIAEEKLVLISELENYNQKRNSLLAENGFSPDKTGMLNCIRNCKEKSAGLADQWSLLCKKISECRSQNQLNGRVMDISLRAVHQSLSILYGQLEQEGGYDAGGSEVNQRLSRSLAKA